MDKGSLAIDPKGLIFEAYRMEGLGPEECRSIFLDWAMSVPDAHAGEDLAVHVSTLMQTYGEGQPDHPMTSVLREGLARKAAPARRRRRR